MLETTLGRIEEFIPKVNIIKNCPLKDYTSFKVGGPAKALIKVQNVDELSKLLDLLRNESIEYFVIGNGSNLLISDQGYEGIVIKLEGDFSKISVTDNILESGAGVTLGMVCKAAYDSGLTGLEFAYGIPGTIGGAMVMNAGAYDGEMKDVVESVTVLTSDGSIKTLSNEEMCFVYRNSIVRSKGYIVLKARLNLSNGKSEEIKAKMDDFMNRRVSKQPLEHPSAGSTFKRPEGYFAGKLIMDANLAGFRVGGACVSPKHCGFVVNDQKGSASDINEVIEYVTDVIYKENGILLEPEVIKIGNF